MSHVTYEIVQHDGSVIVRVELHTQNALAFAVQAWAQQITTATRAELIFALEPVVAWAFSYVVIGERLPPRGILGAILILAGVLVAELKPIGLRRHST